MAPGDKRFHLVKFEKGNNKFEAFTTRKQADEAFNKLDDSVPRILLSGETGDILLSKGSQNMRDQCLGMFMT